MLFRCPSVALLALPLFSLVPGPRLGAADPATEAIDRGIEYLLPATEKHLRGLKKNSNDHAIGQLALQVYALVVAGVSVEHPVIRRSFAFLKKIRLRHIYTISCYAFALDAAIGQLEADLALTLSAEGRARLRRQRGIGKPFRERLQAAVSAILAGHNDTGGWRYHVDSDDVDNSNTQFAVLALGVGARRGLAVPATAWREILEYFVENQEADGDETDDRIALGRLPSSVTGDVSSPASRKKRTGVKAARTAAEEVLAAAAPETETVLRRGWDYVNKGTSNWNMTCAGLSSLLVAKDYLGRVHPQLREDLIESIRDGYGWIMANWSFEHNYYGMYSLEKVADLGHVERFGPHDWYKEISEHLVREQKVDGKWAPDGGGWNTAPVATSFALLVLNRATSLIISSPANRIVLSGHGGTTGGSDHEWVYIPKIDTRVHYPSVLRNLKLRPSQRLVRFLKDVVEHYPPEWIGELVPSFLEARETVPSKRLRRSFDKYLATITGLKRTRTEDLEEWHKRWQRAREVGRTRDRTAVPELLAMYPGEKSLRLKMVLIWALEQTRAREALPLYLEDMSHKNGELRARAYSALRGFFLDAPPPFEADAPASRRNEQVEAIRAWLAQRPER